MLLNKNDESIVKSGRLFKFKTTLNNIDFLINRNVPFTPLNTGHILLDIDVTPHDNSRTQKENVSRIYKSMDGYAPIACYLTQEG